MTKTASGRIPFTGSASGSLFFYAPLDFRAVLLYTGRAEFDYQEHAMIRTETLYLEGDGERIEGILCLP